MTTLAWAQEPFKLTWNPSTEVRAPAVGDRVAVSMKDRWKVKNSRLLEGEPQPVVLEQERHLISDFEREITKVEGGEVQAYKLTFSLWTYSSGDKTHTDLEGAEVVLTRGKRGFAPPPSEKPRPYRVQRFLEDEARRLTDPELATFLPTRALKSGERWAIAPADARRHWVRDARIDAKESEAEASLTQLAPNKVRLEVEAKLALATLPGTDTRTEGKVVWDVKATYRLTPSTRPCNASSNWTARFRGAGTNQTPDGTPFRLETEARGQRTVKVVPLPKR